MKTPGVGIIERGGRVVAQITRKLTSANLKRFALDNASPDSVLMTNEYLAYNIMDREMTRLAVKHKCKKYVSEDGYTHTNTIESF